MSDVKVSRSAVVGVIGEIEALRHRNEVLEARAETLEIVAAALGLKKTTTSRAAVDPAWLLRNALEASEREAS